MKSECKCDVKCECTTEQLQGRKFLKQHLGVNLPKPRVPASLPASANLLPVHEGKDGDSDDTAWLSEVDI